MLRNSCYSTLVLSTIIVALAGCDPAEESAQDFEVLGEGLGVVELDARQASPAWDGPVLSPEEPTILPDGDWDVMALSDSLPERSLERVLAAARRTRGAVLFSVQETDHRQFVVATPHGGAKAGSPSLDQMVEILTNDADHTNPRATVCNRLYRHPYWVGSQFMICGQQASGGHGYANLGVYGFDNVASSYYIDSTTNDISLYNGTGYTSFLISLDWDKASFPSAYNDKASSIFGMY